MHLISTYSRRAAGMVVVGLLAMTGISCTNVAPEPAAHDAAEASHDVQARPATDCGVQFVEMMIPHHRQAVEMGRLANTRARDERVRRMAEAIHVSQDREISVLRKWLTSTVPEGHRHARPAGSAATMPGMLNAAEMRALRLASGKEFDAAYLRGMIRHHWGAVGMSEHALRSGVKRPAGGFATDTVITQRAEIIEMERLLRTLVTGVEITPERFAQEIAQTPLVNPVQSSAHPDCTADT